MDPVEALESCSGAASWRRLRRLGVTWYSLWQARLGGSVLRLRRGAYGLAGADPVVLERVRLGGILSCSSAAVVLGLPVLFDRGVHVTVPRSWGHASSATVDVHRRDLAADEHDGVATALLRTVVDCCRELPLREALVVADAALRAGLDIGLFAQAASRAKGPGSAGVRAVAELVDWRAESPIESVLRLIALPLAHVEVQVVVVGVGRVDLLLDGWLVVEGDGFEFHSTRAHYRQDRRRTNALVALGYVVLRFSYEDVVHRPEEVAATIAAVLARRGTPAA